MVIVDCFVLGTIIALL